jgi:hypothetical protein
MFHVKHRLDWTEHINRRFAGETPVKPAAPAGKPFKLTPYEPREAAVLSSILQALAFYPKVAWYERINSGAYTVGEGASKRYVRFGFEGCSDIIGQLKDGRFLAIEVKRAAGTLSKAQSAFLERVRGNGGIAFVARSISDLKEKLGEPNAG